jgi:hypothetical protein
VEHDANGDFSAKYNDGMTEDFVNYPDGTSKLTRVDKNGNTCTYKDDLDGSTTITINDNPFKVNKDKSITIDSGNGEEHITQDELAKILTKINDEMKK